jgi:apolipoprotein N-acyltransferase
MRAILTAASLFASGCGLALAFLPGFWWLLLWLPAIAFVLLREVGVWRGLIGGWLWGLGFYLTLGFWASPVFEQRADSPLYAGIALAVAALWLSAFYALFGVVVGVVASAKPLLWAALLASAWTVCQWLRGLGTYGFPWAQLSVALTQQPLLIQAADVGGVWLLEWSVAFWNALLGSFLRSVAHHRALRGQPAALGAALLLVALIAWAYGQSRFQQHYALTLGEPMIRVGVLQYGGGVFPEQDAHALDRWCAEARQRTLSWLVLPESTARIDPSDADWQRWQQRARQFNGTLLLGVGRRVGENLPANSACALRPDLALDCYDKAMPTPFTETRPLFPQLAFWQRLGLNPNRSVQAGTHPSAITGADGTKVGALICGESMYGWVARAMVRDGAQWLAVLSNDDWLPSMMVRLQFAQYCALRAVECRRWVVRASPTGVSGVWTPAGTWRGPALDEPALWVDVIGARSDWTLWTRWGDWVVYLSIASLVVGLLLRTVGSFRPQRSCTLK